MKIQEMAEKPREKALLKGMDSLSDTELLTLIIESGSKQHSAFELAMQILAKCGSMQQLPQLSYAALCELPGIKNAKAIRILACVELAKRISFRKEIPQFIGDAKDVYCYLESQLIHEKQENFVALYLDSKHQILRQKTLFIGGLDTSLVHPREVFKEAFNISAASIVVAHNHPSGDPTPSKQDIEITKILNDTGKIMHIPLLDHIVLGNQSFFSFRESGFLDESTTFVR